MEAERELVARWKVVHNTDRLGGLAQGRRTERSCPDEGDAGRVRVSFSAPTVVLTSVGARSGERRDIPLTYLPTEMP